MRSLALALAAAALVACGSPAPEISRGVGPGAMTSAPRFVDLDPHDWTDRSPWNYPVHGVDVSRWQGDIDWNRLRASGAAFAFIKATEGDDHADDRFAANWRAAQRAGVPRGAYHFYYFCSSAADQAAWFIRNVPREPGALPPVLDVEWNAKSRTCRLRPGPEVVRTEMGVFITAVRRRYGQRPVVYVTPDFYRENELWRISGVSFWLRSVAGHPAATYPGQDWAFWQYTGTGMIPGIDGPADINVFAGSPTQWQAWVAEHRL